MKTKLLLSLLLILLSVTAAHAQEPEEAIALIKAATAPEVIHQYPSPDGTRAAEVTAYACTPVDILEMAYEVLELVDLQTGERQQIAEQLRVCDAVGAFGLSTQYWSTDGALLYYTDAREGAPDGGGFWLPPLIRVQISDLSATPLGNSLLSPLQELIAAWDQNQLVIWNAADGQEVARFASYDPEGYLLEIFWLPDSSGVVYMVGDRVMPPITRSALIRADIASAEQTVLLETGG